MTNISYIYNHCMNNQEQYEVACELIESTLSPNVWRTKRRIQDLMLQNPDFTTNPYVALTEFIARQLLHRVLDWTVKMVSRNDLWWDTFEEWESEPILYRDACGNWDDPDDELWERIYLETLVKQNIPFNDSMNPYFHAISWTCREEGWMKTSIFYKRTDTPNSRQIIHHPTLELHI